MSANSFTAFYLENGTLRVAFMLNNDAHMDLLRDWIAASARLADTKLLVGSTVPLAMLASVQR